MKENPIFVQSGEQSTIKYVTNYVALLLSSKDSRVPQRYVVFIDILYLQYYLPITKLFDTIIDFI